MIWWNIVCDQEINWEAKVNSSMFCPVFCPLLDFFLSLDLSLSTAAGSRGRTEERSIAIAITIAIGPYTMSSQQTVMGRDRLLQSKKYVVRARGEEEKQRERVGVVAAAVV